MFIGFFYCYIINPQNDWNTPITEWLKFQSKHIKYKWIHSLKSLKKHKINIQYMKKKHEYVGLLKNE